MKINDYTILAKKRYADGYYYVDGYKTLPTMKKRYNQMIDALKDKPHDKIMLVARDYNGNIIKTYFKED